MAKPTHSILEGAGLASGLLTQDQIDHAWHELVSTSAAKNRSLEEITDELLADQLVELGHLNRWQAVQLQHGRTKFTLGPYRILDAIGHGGMGYVFKCEHTLLGRIEAIKVLPRSQMDAASVDSFLREIRAQAQLDHPHLVRLTFADADGDTYFLVTEYVPGADLRRLIRHHGPLSEPQAALVISQAAQALHYAHQRGLVHRDVKPGNLLVTPDGHTKLTDLGLAAFSTDAAAPDGPKGASDARHRHSVVGTPDFVAPESILTPGDVRPVSDIYSLGCTLYYALTGKVPFPGGATRDKLRRHIEEVPLTPLRFSPQLSGELVELVASMMQKSPQRRTQLASEVIDGLQPWTQRADDQTWHELGQYATEPGERSYLRADVGDTMPSSPTDISVSPPLLLHHAEPSRTTPPPSDPIMGRGVQALIFIAVALAAAALALMLKGL